MTSQNFLTETRLYYNIDYETWDEPQEDMGRFHAQWRRQNPCIGIAEPPEMSDHTFQHAGFNLTGEGNYTILEAKGSGQFVGCNLNIHNLRRGKGGENWYGEGDEMIIQAPPTGTSLNRTSPSASCQLRRGCRAKTIQSCRSKNKSAWVKVIISPF